MGALSDSGPSGSAHRVYSSHRAEMRVLDAPQRSAPYQWPGRPRRGHPPPGRRSQHGAQAPCLGPEAQKTGRSPPRRSCPQAHLPAALSSAPRLVVRAGRHHLPIAPPTPPRPWIDTLLSRGGAGHRGCPHTRIARSRRSWISVGLSVHPQRRDAHRRRLLRKRARPGGPRGARGRAPSRRPPRYGPPDLVRQSRIVDGRHARRRHVLQPLEPVKGRIGDASHAARETPRLAQAAHGADERAPVPSPATKCVRRPFCLLEDLAPRPLKWACQLASLLY